MWLQVVLLLDRYKLIYEIIFCQKQKTKQKDKTKTNKETKQKQIKKQKKKHVVFQK